MESIIRMFFTFIAKAHGYILTLNDANEANFSDKELHFIVIGLFGIALLLVVYPLFKILGQNHMLIIAFIYSFTVVVGTTFAIEIGQRMSGSGTMDLVDIEFGIVGFLFMFTIFAVIRAICMAIFNIFKSLISK